MLRQRLRSAARRLRHRERLRAENRRLRAVVDRLAQERDAARWALTEPEAADQPRHLFVVTYGRSGSTLLMGVLNSLPGYCLRGENSGIVYDLFRFHSGARQASARYARSALTSREPWYGIDEYPEEVATARLRRLVVDTLLRPPPGTRVTGFKEIRWAMPKPVAYLDFIETVFPGARFILNTRNLDDVAKSSWHGRKPNARAELEAVEERLRNAVAGRGDRSYHVHYDDYVKDREVLRGLYDWLGEEYRPERIAAVLDTEHSYVSPERRNAVRARSNG